MTRHDIVISAMHRDEGYSQTVSYALENTPQDGAISKWGQDKG